MKHILESTHGKIRGHSLLLTSLKFRPQYWMRKVQCQKVIALNPPFGNRVLSNETVCNIWFVVFLKSISWIVTHFNTEKSCNFVINQFDLTYQTHHLNNGMLRIAPFARRAFMHKAIWNTYCKDRPTSKLQLYYKENDEVLISL